MNSRKKTGIALAGVSLIALSVTLGAVPALSDDYAIDTDVIDVEITSDIAGSVINNAVVGDGSNDFGIKVRNDAVVAGDLVNNDTVTAAYTASAPIASTSVAGIVVWSGGQVDGQVINNGTVSAESGATGALALAQGYGIITEGDGNPSISNSEGASVAAEASASASDYALSIAGGIGETGVELRPLEGLPILGGLAGPTDTGQISNAGSIDVAASAKLLKAGEADDSAHDAISLAFGAGQLLASEKVSASITNAESGEIAVTAAAEAKYHATDRALAGAAGLLQLGIGGKASGLVANEGKIDVGVETYATSTARDAEGSALALGLGAGSLQLISGGGTTAAAEMANDGQIAVVVGSRAETAGDNLALALGAGLGAVQIVSGPASAEATMANRGGIGVTADGTASGVIAAAIGAGAANVQAALALSETGVAAATATNEGDITINTSADAAGVMMGVAVSAGLGNLQLAISGAGSTATMTNNGKLDVAVESTAAAKAGNALAIAAGLGAVQASASLLGAADATLANNSKIGVNAATSGTGESTLTDTIAAGAIQIAGSFGFDGTASLTNSAGAVIDAAADAEAIGVSGSLADSYVIGAGQIGISGMSVAATELLNRGHISAHANSDGEATDAAGSTLAEANAAAIDQLALSGGGVAELTVTNLSGIHADATVTAEAASAVADARAQGINQYGFAGNARLNVNNSGNITVSADGSAAGDQVQTNASATGIVQAALSGNAQVGLNNTGNIAADAKASAPGTTAGGARAVAVGQMVRQPVELLIGLPSDLNLPNLVPTQLLGGLDLNAILPVLGSGGLGAVVGGGNLLDTGDLPGGLSGLLGNVNLPGNSLLSDEPTNLWLDVNNAAGARIESLSQASAESQAHALAAGGWYENLFGGLTGGIDNAGIISATAIASGATAMAEAVGVAEISATSNTSVLNNSGAIMAYAVGPETSATGIAVASPTLLPQAMSAARVDATTVLNNRGGAIAAIEAREENGAMLRGTAINTRGGLLTANDILTGGAANAVEINLQGGNAGSIGKDFVTKSELASVAVQGALAAEQSWGYVYGNIQVTADDRINVTEGATIFDGVINAGKERGVGTLNVSNGGTLVMLQNSVNGPSGGRVATLDMNSRGTLAYELTTETAPGTYAQIVAGTANVEGGKVMAIYDRGLYGDKTVYDNVISAETLQGTVSTVDNSPLLVSEAVNDGENGIDLHVRRVAFNRVAGLSGNERSAAGAIENVYDKLTQRSDFGRLVADMFALNRNQYKDALAQLSGAEYAQHLQSVLWSTRALTNIISERMACTDGAAYVKTSNAANVGDATVVPTADVPMASSDCRASGQASVWARGFGQWNNLDGDSNAPGYDEDQYGFMFGADYAFQESLFLGIAGGYFNATGNFDSWGGQDGVGINYDGLQLAAYGGYDNSVYYLRGVVSYGNYSGESNRDFGIPGVSPVQLSGDPSSDTWSFYGETGYRFGLSELGSLTPFAGLSIATASLSGFTEDQSRGSGAALEVHDANANSVASILGARFEADVPMGAGVFMPAVSVSWMHEFGDTAQEVDMSFAGAPAGADFTAKGSAVAGDSVLVDAGAKFGFTEAVDVGVFYNGQFNADYTSNAVTARFGYKF